MASMPWTEQDLSGAAKCVAESMLQSFPSPSECEHAFSDNFEQSMELLQRKSKRMATAHKVWQRVAAVLIVAILSLSTWLTVDVEARERVFQWLKETYENLIVYRFDGGQTEEAFPTYEPLWIPDGFTIQQSNYNTGHTCDIYMNENSGEIFLIECSFMDNAAMSMTVNNPSAKPAQYDINGIPGDFYDADENSTNRSLIWVDVGRAMVFDIQGNISEQDMVHIARSLVLSDSTK